MSSASGAAFRFHDFNVPVRDSSPRAQRESYAQVACETRAADRFVATLAGRSAWPLASTD